MEGRSYRQRSPSTPPRTGHRFFFSSPRWHTPVFTSAPSTPGSSALQDGCACSCSDSATQVIVAALEPEHFSEPGLLTRSPVQTDELVKPQAHEQFPQKPQKPQSQMVAAGQVHALQPQSQKQAEQPAEETRRDEEPPIHALRDRAEEPQLPAQPSHAEAESDIPQGPAPAACDDDRARVSRAASLAEKSANDPVSVATAAAAAAILAAARGINGKGEDETLRRLSQAVDRPAGGDGGVGCIVPFPHKNTVSSASESTAAPPPFLPALLTVDGEVTRSLVLSACMLQQLASAVPCRFTLSDWKLLYSTNVHGISLNTLYLRAHGCGACVLAIRSSDGRAFGGCISEFRQPEAPERFVGGGESFLFQVQTMIDLPPLPHSNAATRGLFRCVQLRSFRRAV